MTALRLEISRSGAAPDAYELDPGIYRVGQDDDCQIQLAHPDVDAQHAILDLRSASWWLEDLSSQTGTLLDGAPAEGRIALKPGQAVTIGPFTLSLAVPSVHEVSAPELSTPEPAPSKREDLVARRNIKRQIHRELVERLDLKRLASSPITQQDLKDKVMATLTTILTDVRSRLPRGLDGEVLIREIYDEAVGLGPLEGLLRDPEITEIMVNGMNSVFVEKHGRLIETESSFVDEGSVLAIIERIVSPLGRRIDESQPYVDARLPDGSRVNAIIHPLSLVGPCLTIRKFSPTPFTAEDLTSFGTWTPQIAEFLKICVKMRKNIIVAGGTGSGKTSLLNVVSSFLPKEERIITIEDAAELKLNQPHVIRLESRPPNIEGKGAILIRDLVRNALRMRPDRIIIGECRGGEALDMLQAMNTGHDGSLTTVHANSPRDVISRMETMVLMSGLDLPIRAIREQVASAVDVIVQISRFSDGTRKVAHVTEIVGLEGDQVTMQDIFEYRQTGVVAGKVMGALGPTGSVPTFLEDINAHGLTLDRSMFDTRRE